MVFNPKQDEKVKAIDRIADQIKRYSDLGNISHVTVLHYEVGNRYHASDPVTHKYINDTIDDVVKQIQLILTPGSSTCPFPTSPETENGKA